MKISSIIIKTLAAVSAYGSLYFFIAQTIIFGAFNFQLLIIQETLFMDKSLPL